MLSPSSRTTVFGDGIFVSKQERANIKSLLSETIYAEDDKDEAEDARARVMVGRATSLGYAKKDTDADFAACVKVWLLLLAATA